LYYESDLEQTVVESEEFHIIPRKYQNRGDPEEFKLYREEYKKLRNCLNSASSRLYESYAILIRECRRQLAVD
jgi:hypothetical protein